MGIDAFGYIAVATSIVGLFSIVSAALASQTTRFIAASLARQDYERANRLFNSALVGTLVVVGVFVIAGIAIMLNIGSIMVIQDSYIGQTQVLIAALTLSACFIFLAIPFSAGLYAHKDFFIVYIFQAINQLTRIVGAVVLFNIFTPQLWFPYIGALLVDAAAFIFYMTTRKKYAPDIKIQLSKFSFSELMEILKSGVWFSITNAGNILQGTINSYLTNILLGAFLAGIYASIMQLPNIMLVLAGAISGAFGPVILRAFATDDHPKLSLVVNRSMKYLGIFTGITTGALVVFSVPFYKLWIGVDVSIYELALLLSLASLPFVCPVSIITQVCSATNKVRFPAIATLSSGILNVCLVLLFCGVINWGLTGLVLAQFISAMIRALILLAPYGAKILVEQLLEIYKKLGFAPLVAMATIVIFFPLVMLLNPNTWLSLIVMGIMYLVIVSFGCYFGLLKSDERKELLAMVKKYRD
jgi:membrane protein EpsK